MIQIRMCRESIPLFSLTVLNETHWRLTNPTVLPLESFCRGDIFWIDVVCVLLLPLIYE